MKVYTTKCVAGAAAGRARGVLCSGSRCVRAARRLRWVPRLSRAAVWRGVTTDYWRRFHWRNLVVHNGLPGGGARRRDARVGRAARSRDAGLRDARADADGREATDRCAACFDRAKIQAHPEWWHVTLLGWPISPRCWKYIPIKQVFEAGHTAVYISRTGLHAPAPRPPPH